MRRLSKRQWSIYHTVESSSFLCPINIPKVCWHSLFTRHFCPSTLLFGLFSLILYQPAAVRGGAIKMYFSWIINNAKSSLCKSCTITAWSSDNCKNVLEPDKAKRQTEIHTYRNQGSLVDTSSCRGVGMRGIGAEKKKKHVSLSSTSKALLAA